LGWGQRSKGSNNSLSEDSILGQAVWSGDLKYSEEEKVIILGASTFPFIFSFDTPGDFPYSFSHSQPTKGDFYQSIDRGGL
jgi:hypothetical protein